LSKKKKKKKTIFFFFLGKTVNGPRPCRSVWKKEEEEGKDPKQL